MNLLRLLSGLVAWVFRRRPKEAVQAVRIVAPPDTHRTHWREHRARPAVVPCQGKSCPLCDAKPSRQSKPGAAEETRHRRRLRSLHRHGWYSVENDKALGHYYCTLAAGGTVMVTNVTISPTGGLAGWPDAVYVGEVVPPNEGGIARAPERFGKPWTPPWVRKPPADATG